jgi:hypothetical protein
MRQWIFVATNSSMPNLVKIGHSEAHPDILLRNYDLSGAAPFPYKLEYKLLLKDSYLIMMNIRKALWKSQKNVSDGWYSISALEAITLIRNEVALFLIDKLKIEVKGGHGNEDLSTVMKVINSIFVLEEDYPCSNIVIFEVREISKIIANIMKDSSWNLRSPWLNRVTGNNHRYVSRS